MPSPFKNRLIIALDVPTIEEAQTVVDRVGEEGGFYKVGYQLFPLGGYDFARRLSEAGKEVFLDLKLFDIGATVERGVRSLSSIGADIVTVHADPDTVKGAVQGREDDNLKVFAVTVLTSWDAETVARHGIHVPVPDLVLSRAEMALKSGADGVIASAQEAEAIKARFGDDLLIVTPGIRPSGAAADDQKRITTPHDAIKSGADALVVGRPIVQSSQPATSARSINAEIVAALK